MTTRRLSYYQNARRRIHKARTLLQGRLLGLWLKRVRRERKCREQTGATQL